MTTLWLARARLRRDAQVAALAPLLLPEDDGGRTMAAHRLVWSLMPPDPDGRRDFLWREEAPGRFMVLSQRSLEPSALFDVEAKPFEPELDAGDRLRFVLRANPTVSRAAPGPRGTRSDVVMHALHPVPSGQRAESRQELAQEAGAAWLVRTRERHGLVLEEGLRADGYRALRIPRPGAPPIRLGTLEYDGVLNVRDPTAFLAGLAGGFGRGRAFGCGLMLIRRV